jgi:hypothetical protein
MNSLKTAIAAAMLLAMSTMLLPPVFVHAGFAQVSSAAPDDYGWFCKNLQEDWNYLFHPNRVNQCHPRGLESDNRLEELSKKAFTRDDPLIPRYCGSPFSSADPTDAGAGK